MLKNLQSTPHSDDAIKALLEQAGIMPTQQRLCIARIILGRPQHMSADQLLTIVNRETSQVSKATVYNTLNLFAEKGLVREVLVDPDKTFFDSNIDKHHHLYNEDTGGLTDVYADCIRPEAMPNLPQGTELVEVDVVIRIRNKSEIAQ